MSYLYAISDPHGCHAVLERALRVIDLSHDEHLYLLGDYISHAHLDEDAHAFAQRAAAALGFVWEFQQHHSGHVTVLLGNHELMLLDRLDEGAIEMPAVLEQWLWSLPTFVETECQIFVHAGIDEEAGDFWRYGSEDWFYCQKYPPTFGPFEKDIIAGHVCLAKPFGQSAHGVYWDGESHYYIDGATEMTGCLPILRYDTMTGVYEEQVATSQGVSAPRTVSKAPDVSEGKGVGRG